MKHFLVLGLAVIFAGCGTESVESIECNGPIATATYTKRSGGGAAGYIAHEVSITYSSRTAEVFMSTNTDALSLKWASETELTVTIPAASVVHSIVSLRRLDGRNFELEIENAKTIFDEGGSKYIFDPPRPICN